MPRQTFLGGQARLTTPTDALAAPCAACPISAQCITVNTADSYCAHNNPNRIRLTAGEHLYWRDDTFHALYVVIGGSFKSYNVDLDGNERVRGFHYPNGLIGFDGIEGGRHRCHVTAMEDASVCIQPFKQLLASSLQTPSLQINLFQRLSRELVHAETLAGDYPADVRLAAFLLEIANGRDTVRLPMARRDIANYLRLATETVSRLMTRFRESGLIQCRGRSITLVDSDGLSEIAEPSLSN